MARLHFKLFTQRERPVAGVLTIEPVTDEEKMALRVFKKHVGNVQEGDRLDVHYKWKDRQPPSPEP